jgi:hypothetical protein
MTDVASPLSSWISIETLPNYDDFPHLFLSEQLAKSDLGPISIGWLVGWLVFQIPSLQAQSILDLAQ